MIAALFVETDGCYYGLENVDPWDQARDAREYRGPHPVVAHPPCQRWGNLAAANYARWGGEHNRPGNDGGCFASAFESVRTFGGVLEHPKNSRAFKHHGIAKPPGQGWSMHTGCKLTALEQKHYTYWVCEVWQSAYGHRANKATWLYYVGRNPPPELRWCRPVGTHQVGFQDRRGKARNKPTLSKREASATPPEFRDVLINLAEASQ